MNVFDKQPDGSQGGYVFEASWGVNDLKTTLIATPGIGTEITNNQLELFPNYNTYSSSDPFWGNGAVGNKWMEARTYVEQTSLAQESVTFSGRVDAYTLSPNYTAEAFIRVLDPANGYTTSLLERQNLTGITEFSLTADTLFFTGQYLQIGFSISGLNANPADMATLGSVRVTTEPPRYIVIDVPAGFDQTARLADYPVESSTRAVKKTGGGTLTLETGADYSLETVIEDGVLRLSQPNGLALSPTVIRGGALEIASDSQLLRIVVGNRGSLDLTSPTRKTLSMEKASFSDDLGLGQVDVGVGRIEIAAGGIAEADVLQAIIAGRDDGGWDGIDGIMSSAAGPESNRAVGYRVLDSGETIISWAAYGDVNLDGRVSSSDINLIINEGLYGTTQPATWASGDFNYDGRVDVLDMTLLTGTGLFGTGSYLPRGPAPSAAGQSLTAAAVPEPGFGVAALAGLSIAVGMLQARLRRGCLHAAAA